MEEDFQPYVAENGRHVWGKVTFGNRILFDPFRSHQSAKSEFGKREFHAEIKQSP